MKTNEVLSQDEIDALLDGVESGKVNVSSEESTSYEVKDFRFDDESNANTGKMPALDKVCAEFVRCLRDRMMAMLRRHASIEIKDIKMVKYMDYLADLIPPNSLNIIKMRPLRGNALVVMTSGLAFIVVENFFGGGRRHEYEYGDRKLAATEVRILQMLFNELAKDIEVSWAPVYPIEVEYINTESNPQMVNIVAPTEMVVVSIFDIEIEGGHGEIHLCMPYAMLEPIRQRLEMGMSTESGEMDERWVKELSAEIKYAEVELNSYMASKQLSLSEILELKIGDVIPFETQENILVYAEQVPIFRATYGNHNGRRSLKIVNALYHKERVT